MSMSTKHRAVDSSSGEKENSMEYEKLPSKDYIHSTVVDYPNVNLVIALEILFELAPHIIRTILACVWVYLLASLVMGKF